MKIIKHFNYLTPFDEAENDEELAKILRLKYPKACSKLETDASFFAKMVEDVRRYEAHRTIGFTSFEEFCERELGQTIHDVEAIVAGVKLLQAGGATGPISAAEAMKAAPTARSAESGRPRKGEASTPLPKGASSARLAARIKRDRPDIAARVEAGEFKSMRAAAIAAGIVKVLSPFERCRRLLSKLDEAELRAIAAIAHELAEAKVAPT